MLLQICLTPKHLLHQHAPNMRPHKADLQGCRVSRCSTRRDNCMLHYFDLTQTSYRHRSKRQTSRYPHEGGEVWARWSLSRNGVLTVPKRGQRKGPVSTINKQQRHSFTFTETAFYQRS